MKAGIYEIRNTVNGHRYIGGTKNISGRWSQHLCLLRRGRHYSRSLQDAWNKYGEAAFQFRVLFYCDPWNCILFEQRAIDVLKPEFNIASTAGSNLGLYHSEETRAKISAALKGNKNCIGHHHSAATRAKRSASLKGNKNHLGYHPSAEARAKMSAAMKGRYFTAATRAKISVAKKGRPTWNKGLHHSVETRAKMSVAHLKLKGNLALSAGCVRPGGAGRDGFPDIPPA